MGSRYVAGLPPPSPPAHEELDLRKIRLERDRIEDEAVREFARERNKSALEHRHSLEIKDEEFRLERLASALAAEDALSKLYHEKVAEVSIAGIDRARDGAKFVQTAATAIFALYTGLLALVYSVTDNPLPLRGAWSGLFLGLAISFATAYLAFLTDVPRPETGLDNRSLVQRQYSRTANLTKWIKSSVDGRRYATRAAVISLFFGVLFIAAPFLSIGSSPPDVEVIAVPVPPSEVAAGFDELAKELFQSQVDDYQAATAARAEALEAAKTSADRRAAREKRLNEQVTSAAVVSLVLVLLGPLVYRFVGWLRRKIFD